MTRVLRLVETTEPTFPTWDNGPAPTVAIIREINFKIEPHQQGEEDDELVFYYSNFTPDKPIGSPAEFQALLKEICGDNYKFEGGRPSIPKDPFETMLSLDSKEAVAYIILKLARRRWQFARKGRPLKIGQAGTDAHVYYDAHRVDAAGVADKGDDPGNIRNGCKVAYFISDGTKVPGGPPYSHPFNLHVDLLFTGGGAQHMPNIMDPDVRHPGGSVE